MTLNLNLEINLTNHYKGKQHLEPIRILGQDMQHVPSAGKLILNLRQTEKHVTCAKRGKTFNRF